MIPVWGRANEQGGWELGLKAANLQTALQASTTAYIVAADPYGDDPSLPAPSFLVVQELFLTETARRADVVFPAQAFTERDGSFTSGERRVQRYYPATPALADCRSDYAISAELGQHLGLKLEGRSAAAIFAQIATEIPAYKGLTYRRLAETTNATAIGAAKDPRDAEERRCADLYYSGAGYENTQGLGVQLPLQTLSPALSKPAAAPAAQLSKTGLLAVPVTQLYDLGQTVLPSALLRQRIGEAWVGVNPADAAEAGIEAGAAPAAIVQVVLPGKPEWRAAARIDERTPRGVLLIPRSMGLPLNAPLPGASIRPVVRRDSQEAASQQPA